MNPLLLADFYKIHHFKMYPQNMTLLYSNFTPRKSRIKGVDGVVVFGIQHFILEYLIDKFNHEFFYLPIESVMWQYQRHCPVDTVHLEKLWSLGYLPLEIKALPEGTICPIGVPVLTIKNTHPEFAWLVNYLETLLSCILWQTITSATIANEYRKILEMYAMETTGNTEGVQWQAHDFSMRGMSSPESAILSGMGHLLSFTGTDTIPAIYQLEQSYKAEGLIGASVPATEHSVMCMGTKEAEIETFARLLDLYPSGILSVVSDTWDLWEVCTSYLPQLKEKILTRDGKLVIRPDSGDPVDIICGTVRVVGRLNDNKNTKVIYNGKYYDDVEPSHPKYGCDHRETADVSPSEKGVIELLWDVFGGTVNEQGYKVLDPHIGAIYGDSITMERAVAICERLKAKGFASTNIVFGVGSYTYQYNTRDTFGFAMKATYGELTHLHCNAQTGCLEEKAIQEYTNTTEEIDICKDGCIMEGYVERREIFKDPVTDDGTKKSKKGLLQVSYEHPDQDPGDMVCYDQQTWEQEKQGLLQTVFLNGQLVKTQTLEEIRERLKGQ